MLQTQTGADPVAQIGWILVTTLAFAALGAAYAYSGKTKNSESFDWAKGKYPTLTLAGAGAIAGVITLLTSGEFDILVFGAALGVVGVVIDQLRTMWQAGEETYDDLREKDVGQFDSATLAFQSAIDEGDFEKMMSAVSGFVGKHGQPNLDNARTRSEEARQTANEESVRELFPEEEVLQQIDDEEEEERPRMRAHSADAQVSDDKAPDTGEHYINDGNGEDSTDESENSDTGLPPA